MKVFISGDFSFKDHTHKNGSTDLEISCHLIPPWNWCFSCNRTLLLLPSSPLPATKKPKTNKQINKRNHPKNPNQQPKASLKF